MVDAERAHERLRRLDALLARLDATRAAGEAAYLADEDARLRTERTLQLAVQICIDLGAQLVAERAVPAPADYAGIFAALGREGLLTEELAARLGDAARLRNLLVHAYLELDDRRVFASLERLDDLREFAAAVARAAE